MIVVAFVELCEYSFTIARIHAVGIGSKSKKPMQMKVTFWLELFGMNWEQVGIWFDFIARQCESAWTQRVAQHKSSFTNSELIAE